MKEEGKRQQEELSSVVGAKKGVANDDPSFDRKLDVVTAGARPFVKEHLLTKISRESCQTIVDYILGS
jgi:hypothetical protein